jgi:hypothetical protein
MNNNDIDNLGQISIGPRDDRLQADDRLKLPRGAFIAFQQSGGLRFSTRGLIVYRDGRVITRSQGKLGAKADVRRITLEEVTNLQAAITHSGLEELSGSIGQPNPDGYAYELIARMGRKSQVVNFFDGSIPAEVKPLLKVLKQLFSEQKTTPE